MTTAITIRGSVRTLFSYSCPIVSIDPAAAVRKSSSFQVFSTEEEEEILRWKVYLLVVFEEEENAM